MVGNWKMLGLAGLAGVAATGAVLVRAERRRQALTPDDVRARLHARHAEAQSLIVTAMPTDEGPSHGRWSRSWRRMLRRQA